MKHATAKNGPSQPAWTIRGLKQGQAPSAGNASPNLYR